MTAPGLFITGTNTGVGKTRVAAMIARWLVERGCRVGVYKPVASGCEMTAGGEGNAIQHSESSSQDDASVLWHAAGKPGTLNAVCPQRFVAPLAPHLAARLEGREVDPQLLRAGIEYWRDGYDVVLVEGAGGLMSPVTDEEYVADLAADFGYPLLVVVPNVLGCINQTLLTLIAAETFPGRMSVAGIVLNDLASVDGVSDPSHAHNRQELERRCIPPVLTRVPFDSQDFADEVDWLSVIRGKAAEPQSTR